MKKVAIVNGILYTPQGVINPGVVLTAGNKILKVGPSDQIRIPKNIEVIDVGRNRVTPGLIDIKIHGAMGYDAMGAGLIEIIKVLPSYGVTSFMAGTLIKPRELILEGIKVMAKIIDDPPTGANCLGIHLEGPYLSTKRSGIANPDHLYPLSFSDFVEFQNASRNHIKLVTFAPEEGEAMKYIPEMLAMGVEPVIGHSDASFEQVKLAVELGLKHSAHVFNAMRPFQHREPGTAGAIMYFDQVYAEVIADGIHVHPIAIDLLIRTKGLHKIVIISDAYRFAGLPNGEYSWEDKKVYVKNNQCELSDGSLMGGYSFLDTGVRNLVNLLGIPFEKALTLATSNAARSVGLINKGALAQGADADLVVFDGQLTPILTIVGGEIVWRK